MGFYPYPPGEQVLGVEAVCNMTAFTMWDLAQLPPRGLARVFVREAELSKTYLSRSGTHLLHPLTSPAACQKAEATDLTLYNIIEEVHSYLASDSDWNYHGDTHMGHVCFLLAMTRNTFTGHVEAYGGMAYCHPFQHRYSFSDAWSRLQDLIASGDLLGLQAPAHVAAVGVPWHPKWTCPAHPRDTYVTWGGQPGQAIGEIHKLLGYPLLNVGVIGETAV